VLFAGDARPLLDPHVELLRKLMEPYVCTNLENNEIRAAVVALADRTPTPEDLAWRHEVGTALSDAAANFLRACTMYTRYVVPQVFCQEAAETLGLRVAAPKTRLSWAQHRMRSELRRSSVVSAHYKNAVARIPHWPAIARTQIAG
jgi:hypothetical protein